MTQPPLGTITDLIVSHVTDQTEQQRLLDYLSDQSDIIFLLQETNTALKTEVRKFTEAATQWLAADPGDSATDDLDAAVALLEDHCANLMRWMSGTDA